MDRGGCKSWADWRQVGAAGNQAQVRRAQVGPGGREQGGQTQGRRLVGRVDTKGWLWRNQHRGDAQFTVIVSILQNKTKFNEWPRQHEYLFVSNEY